MNYKKEQKYKKVEIGLIPKDWNICSMADISIAIIDCLHSRKPKFINEGDNLYLEVDNIGNDGELDLTNKNLVSKDVYKEWTKRLLPQYKDMVITKTGRVASAAMIPKDIKCCIGRNQVIIRVDKNKIIPEFLLYYLLSSCFKNELKSKILSGTILESLHVKYFPQLRLPYPSLKEQGKIVGILNPIYKRIYLNRKINETLESISQYIFKHWFIDFEFPNEQDKPYKSSGGEFIDSELGKIPKGWEYISIGNIDIFITDLVANGSFASIKKNLKIYDTPNYALFIRNTDLKVNFKNSKKYISKLSYNFLAKSRLFGGELIISNVGDVGSVFLCPNFNIPMSLGNNLILVDSKNKEQFYNYYLFFLFKSKIGQGLIKSITTGSVQSKFNKTDFKKLKIVIPNKKIIKDFNLIVSSIIKLKSNKESENDILLEIRDTLLPKLITGKIRVNLEDTKEG
jgi:type I restriction enzyme, S subunit